MPGSSLRSKPTWWKAFGRSTTSAFFVFVPQRRRQPPGDEIDGAAHFNDGPANCPSGKCFPTATNGPRAKAVTVVLSEDTLVITLHGALSAAEEALAKSPAGAAQVQDFHRELFANSCEPLRQEIKRITGVEVRESAAEVEPSTGTVVQVFTSGTMVQVFLLAHSLPAGAWNGTGPRNPLAAPSQDG